MEDRLFSSVFTLVLAIVGSVLIIYNAGWLTFFGVFLLMWANNVGTSLSTAEQIRKNNRREL